MKYSSILKILLSGLICLAVSFIGYTEIIGFSAALPRPTYLDTTNIFDWWAFHIVTMLVPYLVLISLISYFSARYTEFWVAPICIIGLHWYWIGLTYSEEFMYVLFVSLILVISTTSFLGYKKRGKDVKPNINNSIV